MIHPRILPSRRGRFRHYILFIKRIAKSRSNNLAFITIFSHVISSTWGVELGPGASSKAFLEVVMIGSFILSVLDCWEFSIFVEFSGTVEGLTTWGSVNGFWLPYFVGLDFMESSLLSWRTSDSIILIKSFLLFIDYLINIIWILVLNKYLVKPIHLRVKILLLSVITLCFLCQLIFCHFSSILHLLFSLYP